MTIQWIGPALIVTGVEFLLFTFAGS